MVDFDDLSEDEQLRAFGADPESTPPPVRDYVLRRDTPAMFVWAVERLAAWDGAQYDENTATAAEILAETKLPGLTAAEMDVITGWDPGQLADFARRVAAAGFDGTFGAVRPGHA